MPMRNDDSRLRLIERLAQQTAPQMLSGNDSRIPGTGLPQPTQPNNPPSHSTPIPPPAPSPWSQLTPMGGMDLAAPHSGPQMEWGNPTLAQLPTVPQFPGVPQHDGTIQGLLGALGNQIGPGGSSGGGTSNDPIITTPDGNQMTQSQWDAYQAKWDRPPGWSGNPNISGR